MVDRGLRPERRPTQPHGRRRRSARPVAANAVAKGRGKGPWRVEAIEADEAVDVGAFAAAYARALLAEAAKAEAERQAA